MPVHTFTVTGMSCGHCAGSVTTELSRLPDVTRVEVDVSTGRVLVDSGNLPDTDAVRAAVRDAGFELAEAAR